jgi:TRAP-type mannitol/chloroaromatic compound transport system permease small subunit
LAALGSQQASDPRKAGGLTPLIDRLNVTIGRACGWLTLVMVVVTFIVVVLRYAFDLGWIWLQETVTWMHAAVFMLAAAYTLARDEHVRVDVFYRNLDPRRQAAIDAAGAILFLIPFCGFLLWSSWDYVSVSWAIREGSREAGGLGYPLPSILKTFIPAMAVMLLLQALVLMARAVRTLRGR